MNADSDTISDNSTRVGGPRRRRRLPVRWWHLYLPLLIASFLVQLRSDGPGPAPAGYHEAMLSTQTADGPVDPPADEQRFGVMPDKVRLTYRDEGPRDGPAVILVHGSPGDAGNFDRLVPILTGRGYRVIAPDLPGFGYAEPYVPDYSNRAHARYLLALMDELDIDSAHLLGFSMGGGVVINAWDFAPERVESITMLAAIGVQEAEGSGDYTFEHLKYGVGYLLFVGGVEFVPHFGILGDRSFRHATLRNFWDTDQRPNREILTRYDKPMLIIHGEADPWYLAPVRVAYDHHAIVDQSELVIYGESEFKNAFFNHAMVFDDESNQLVANALLPFLDKYAVPGTPPTRRTLDRSGGMKQRTLQLPGNLQLGEAMSPWAKMGVIILGTFILEDPTAIAVGLFIKAGQLDPFVGGFALMIGIFLGDLGLYLIGYVFGRQALKWKPIARWVPTRHIDQLGNWFDTHGWKAVLASRFIPGSRFPLYVAAGVTGNKATRFMLWTFLAVSVWIPVILICVLLLGEAARSPFQVLLDRGGWVAFVGVVLGLMVLLHTLLALLTRDGRRKLAIRLRKQWKYEYWPGWKFYLPLVPYFAWLCLKYRSFTVWTLADPCMPDGGVVGESKCDILDQIDDPAVLAHLRMPAGGEPLERAKQAEQLLAERGWAYPVILKPDAAQRGAGVKLVHTHNDLLTFFEQCPGDAQLQRYHPGPCEAGVFYTRMPDEPSGRIFSITDKVFPVVTGDGRSTLEELIWKHPRYRFQHGVFHARFADDLYRVLDDGEELRLAQAGNHAQGTLFRDGARFITPELEERIDQLAKRLDGFYFGRIDLRYTDEESFMRGENLAVIEINGVTSESTNLYDPSWSLWMAHKVLREQWASCFAIGDRVRQTRGLKPARPLRLLRDIFRYYRARSVSAVSD